jgi:hypothetical protein
MRVLILMMTAATAAFAQNTDLGLLLGVSQWSARVQAGSGVSASTSVGVTGQVNLAFQMKETSAGRLYLEVPFLAGAHVGTQTGGRGTVLSSTSSSLYCTPGIRWNVFPHSRVSLYVAAGAGVVAFNRQQFVVWPATVESEWTAKGAAEFGGGLDFRLTRLMSLRMEARDFIASKKVDVGTGYHHPVVSLGMGFHW